jgi:hypothetical protein
MGRESNNRRPAFGATAVRKNVFNTIQKKKVKADHESYKKAKVLKKYSKLVAEEGLTSDRVNMGKKVREDEAGRDSTWKARKGEKHGKSEGARKVKPAPFKRAMEKADARKNEIATSKAEAAARLREKAGKDKAREEKRKVHLKRTKKGQPLMKNQITSMLDKLQRDKAAAAAAAVAEKE